MFLKKITLTITCLFLGLYAQAQQMVQVKQFFNNALIYNPAAAGMQETEFNVGLMTKLPGTSMKGAPLSNFLWGDYRFDEKSMALGINANYLKHGAQTQVDFMANYSYHLQFGGGKKLGMGLRAGVSNIKFDGDLQVWDAGDPTLANQSFMLPKFGLGFLYESRTFYAGLTSPDLIVVDNKDVLQNKDRAFLDKKRNFVANAGYRLKLGDQYQLQPNVIYYYYPTGANVADMNLSFVITDYFWLGGSYATNNSYGLNAGTYISSRFKLGYAYQGAVQTNSDNRLNTHEINLIVSLDDLFK